MVKDWQDICGEEKEERERRERETWGRIGEKGRDYSFNVIHLVPGHCVIAAWAPACLKLQQILQHSQRLGAVLGHLGAQFLFFFSTPLKYHHMLIYIYSLLTLKRKYK